MIDDANIVDAVGAVGEVLNPAATPVETPFDAVSWLRGLMDFDHLDCGHGGTDLGEDKALCVSCGAPKVLAELLKLRDMADRVTVMMHRDNASGWNTHLQWIRDGDTKA